MPDDYDDVAEAAPVGAPEFPKTVRTAGIIWIVFGGLIVLQAVASTLMSLASSGQGPGAGGGAVCGGVIGALFGGAFVLVGVQSVNGTAGGTLANGIGSIIFALLYGGFGALAMIGGMVIAGGGVPGQTPGADAGSIGAAAIIGGAVMLIGALGLLVAGIMAIMGREQYHLWLASQKKAKKRRSRSRARDEEEYDDDDA